MSEAAASAPALPAAPGLARRLACFLYEGVLLFGVVTISGLLYSVLTDQRHALEGAPGMRAFLFAVLGLYFVYFWSRQGQTLAMQTWHIRLLTRDGRVPGWPRALARYLLSWMWFAPALLLLELSGLKGGLATTVIVTVGVLAYAALARLHPERQYWHDAVCGTRLVDWRPSPRP
ncbi:MAG: RDD family protein [Pseudomonadota bacterium]|nr:RDD family protein [Rubrivivax sp.]MCA3259327.1 RDD family protein [Rubrivivax sp.]MCE2910833.1 RDD family protein [Rubrivivax sp.]MCZ8031078.1 RDD family protein [Rubrivivax sp.]